MTSLINCVAFLAADLLPLLFLVLRGEEFPVYLLLYDLAHLPSKPAQLLAITGFLLFRGIVVPLLRQ